MGYILPIQHHTYEQYANRIQATGTSRYPDLRVSKVQPVQFDHVFEEQLGEPARQITHAQSSEAAGSPEGGKLTEYRGYIQPNPANLSPAIAKVSGKGRRVNAYC